MGIFDWLYERKRKKETLEQFEQMEREYDPVRLEEGQITEQGGAICPGCGYEMSLAEYLEQWKPGSVRILTCPRCQKKFKTH